MFAVTQLVSLLALPHLALGSLPNAWDELNKSVDGRLVQGIPFARPCFAFAAIGTGGTFDHTECALAEENYLNHFALTENLGGYINTQWETCQQSSAECLLDSTAPNNSEAYLPPRVCSQGSIPDFGINVSTAQDVIEGIEFTRRSNVPLVIKNSGHDYKGRSGGPGTLALWLFNLKSISRDPQFVPTGCPSASPQNSVTIGAGVSFSDLEEFAFAQNLTIPSGGDLSVGAAGGYPQGGGHGILSNVYGLAADRVLEYEVVTPRGDHVFANECQYSDLFFALRGGGGGTFGVVLKMTTLVFPATPINAVFAAFDSSVPGQRLKFLRFVTDNSLDFAKKGWGAYILPTTGILLANPILTPAEANTSMNALRTFIISNLTGSFTMTVEPDYKTYFDNYIGALIHIPVGIPLTIASRLIPAENFETESQRIELTDALNSVVDKVDIAIAFATTPFLHGNKNRTSVSPAWYQSLWHIALGSTWSFNTSASDVAQKYSDLTAAAEPFRQLTPSSGAYQNEADVYEPNHEQSFWGHHYPRLLSIKDKYDPEHIFDCWQCGKCESKSERHPIDLPH